MEIEFIEQDYQQDAVNAVLDLFEGQVRRESALEFLREGGVSLIANRLDISHDVILNNLQAVQRAGGLAVDDALKMIHGTIETLQGIREIGFPNYSIEMETGTGKTYVYLRTALSLAKKYGLNKFIIVVPSVAIREGVLKTLQITKKHFGKLFGNITYDYKVYESGSLTRLKKFVESPHIEFLIMTVASFDKEKINVIHQKNRDNMNGVSPLFLLQQTHPILILDEPQNMKTDPREQALANFNPLFALRYSATHPEGKEFNRVYRLSPYEAYRRHLVKEISVAGIQLVGQRNNAYMRLDSIGHDKRRIIAKIEVDYLDKKGEISQKVVNVRHGDNLQKLTNLPQYAPFRVEDISNGVVYFENSARPPLGQDEPIQSDEARFYAQIRYTIEEHFKKQAQLRPHGVKVLSLFFIDKVSNYAPPDSLIRKLFRDAFDKLKKESSYVDEWGDVDANAVQGAYFAKTNAGQYKDTKGDSEDDKKAYDLIMRDKESLLTFASSQDDEETKRKRQICFIFSHSALREGWDNPNVFQVCILRASKSDMTRRQQIGRGVRLPVNQQGARYHNPYHNILTVVANETVGTWVAGLQAEVERDYGDKDAIPMPTDARQRIPVYIRESVKNNPDFQLLWDKIRQKTRYAVQVDDELLIKQVIDAINQHPFESQSVRITKAHVHVNEETNKYQALASGGKNIRYATTQSFSANILESVSHILQFTQPPIKMTKKTLIRCLSGLNPQKRQEALQNPQEFSSVLAHIIRDKLADQLVDGILYQKIDEWYEMSQFKMIETHQKLLPAQKSLYEQVIIESDIEHDFVQELEKTYILMVKAYVKLPYWFVVPTPIGNYTPDWAIVATNSETGEDNLYFVAETKSTLDLGNLYPNERRKIFCGKRHFEDGLGVTYKHVIMVKQLFE